MTTGRSPGDSRPAHRHRRVSSATTSRSANGETISSGCARSTARRRRRSTSTPTAASSSVWVRPGRRRDRFLMCSRTCRFPRRRACSPSAPASRSSPKTPARSARALRERVDLSGQRTRRGFLPSHVSLRPRRAARTYCAGRGLRVPRSTRSGSATRPTRWQASTRNEAQTASTRDRGQGGSGETGQRGPYDFYRGRLMIPTLDHGEVVAFGGRALDGASRNTSTRRRRRSTSRAAGSSRSSARGARRARPTR